MLQTLKTLSNSQILDKVKTLVSEERRISTEILWHLREIESRGIFSEMGYGSMFEMLTHHFGYTEGSAYRRLSAARLFKDLPEIEPALKEGKLTLTTVSLAHGFFQNEKKAGNPYSQAAKNEVLKCLEGKSRLEAERELAKRAPEPARPEHLRTINGNETELRITFSEAQMAKLRKLKLLHSHKHPKLAFADLIELLADSELKRIDPELRPEVRKGSKRTSPGDAKTTKTIGNPENRAASALLKSLIWKRAQGRCEFQDLTTGKRCGSQFMLELDHRTPYSLGGKTEEANLRLYCRNHNIRAAVNLLGPELMHRYTGG